MPNPKTDPEAELESIRRWVHAMDSQFRFPGMKRGVGWDALIGLLPGVGDVASLAISAWLTKRMAAFELPAELKAKMVANILLDAATGIVPLAGDLLDVVFRANRRNLKLLEAFLAAP
ncbi:MAG: DUF4112 domain-containing protein [Verrucomicrobiota bacterium]